MFTLTQLLEEIIELPLIRINLKIGTHTHIHPWLMWRLKEHIENIHVNKLQL